MCPSGGAGALAAGTVSRYKTGPRLAIHRIPYIWTGRYLNHSSEAANIVSVEGEEEGQFSTYRSTRLIRAGEELLTDYRDGLESMYARISSL